MTTTSGSVPSCAEGGPVVRIRLDISYDGTDFAGWAIQPGLRTVAGVLGEALALLFRGRVPLVVAGRTDSGVHAVGQVAHIDVDPLMLDTLASRPRRGAPATELTIGDGPAGLQRRLAGLLPADVRVRSALPAAEGFDARFSALRRHYRYLIGTAPWGVDPMGRHAVLALGHRLDADRMNRAAATLVGLADFATFCKPRVGATTIRDLQRLEVSSAGDEVTIDVTADAFCHSMVRSLVGVLIAVGEGRLGIAGPARMLAGRRRASDVYTAAARGLTLVAVDYPADAELAKRAAQTRAVRQDGQQRRQRSEGGKP
ncbi:MAG: tRNA pseudouridine(38-40) synthase TruA [Actinomycetota bacterium]|nr:tRNA pseudouridine(38-40) synthase TruA [Actinomycetota bacterium]